MIFVKEICGNFLDIYCFEKEIIKVVEVCLKLKIKLFFVEDVKVF